MATRKRNEWLDADESQEEERGYDSEDEGRTQLLPSSKRQKIEHHSADEDDDGEGEGEQHFDEDDIERIEDVEDNEEIKRLKSLSSTLPSSNPLDLSKSTKPRRVPLKPEKPKKDRSGIIYLSRVPPFMKPSVLRSLLAPYGAIGRIFLTPESSTSRTQRLRGGGTRRKLFLDGWVEFLSKKDAKFVAENLNAQIIGGKKRSRWHDEVWNIKYLTGVKWAHLVEQVKNENAERAARLRADIAQSTRENRMFLENVERGKMVRGMEEKRKKRFGEDGEELVGDEAATETRAVERGPTRTFKQSEVRLKGEKKAENGDDVTRVLSKIF